MGEWACGRTPISGLLLREIPMIHHVHDHKKGLKKGQNMVDVITLGECMALVYPSTLSPLAQSSELHLDMAGAESNFCIGLSRLGFKSRFISRLGNDPLGEFIRLKLAREGVLTDALKTDTTSPTGVFFREHLADGQRRVYYYRKNSAASLLSPDDLDITYFTGARVLHLTGITPALSASCSAACLRAIDLAKSVGTSISFDPNYRPQLWSEEEARKVILPILEQSDFVLMGHEDARAILGIADENDALKYVSDLGVKIIVMKRAERGAVSWSEGQILEIPAYPVDRVIDPVGAGDGFDAGFIAGWLKGWNLERCLALGARVGAGAVRVLGDYNGYPYAQDVF
jgi:2-dehydro-3-deoxygluconokinase